MNNWPPVKGNIVSIKKPNESKVLIGKVSKKLWGGKAVLVLLMNDNEYVDDNLKGVNLGYSNKGLVVLYPNYEWKYVDYKCDDDIAFHINNVAKGYNYFKQKYLK